MSELQRILSTLPPLGSAAEERQLGQWLRLYLVHQTTRYVLPPDLHAAALRLRTVITRTWPSFRAPRVCPLPLQSLPAYTPSPPP